MKLYMALNLIKTHLIDNEQSLDEHLLEGASIGYGKILAEVKFIA